MLKTVLGIHNLPKILVCCTTVCFCLVFLALIFFIAHFLSFIFPVSKPSGFVLGKDRALKFGSLSLCVGIFILMFNLTNAHKTLCIMAVQSYIVLDPLAHI